MQVQVHARYRVSYRLGIRELSYLRARARDTLDRSRSDHPDRIGLRRASIGVGIGDV